MSVKNRRLTLLFLLAVLGAGVFGVYAPGLEGPFVFDDYPNIVDNPLVAVDALDAGYTGTCSPGGMQWSVTGSIASKSRPKT